MKRELGTDGFLAGEAMLARGEFNEFLNVLRAAAAAAGFFETKLSFDLARHHDPRTARGADIRLRDSFTQAKIQGGLFFQ